MPEQSGDATAQIRQRVAVLGEDHQLLRGVVPGSRRPPGAGGEDLAKQAGELSPLGIFSAAPHCERDPLHVPQGADLSLQFGDRTCGRGLIEDLVGGLLLLVRRQILQVFQFVRVQLDAGQSVWREGACAAASQQFQLAQAAL